MVDSGGGLWGVMTILGPIILAAVILWAILHNRTSAREKQRTEDATRKMYDAQNEEDTRREP
ncbi:putative membrane protein [Sphingomonas sp. BE123]|jgi:hypothetical protein|uniref:hypothetical protein n=1 Tax=unclassified Sphingomonas TaxID=196159 RepID=UPI0028607F20|nr:hypothetical protein [Sphingomonas sp. BE123]MDR6852226.1 putative membrane protein [Sphingomonas sp. BE123]